MTDSARTLKGPKATHHDDLAPAVAGWLQIGKWVLSAAGVCLVLLSSSHRGPAMSPDSIDYLSAAESFGHGDGFLMNNGQAFTSWPPLLPVLVSVGSRVFHCDLLTAASVLNAVCYGLIVFLGITYLQSKAGGWSLISGTLAILFAAPVFRAAGTVYSEPIYVVLCLGFLLQLERFPEKRILQWLGVLTVLAAAACLARYVGVVLIMTGVVALALFANLSLRKRIGTALIFSVLAALPLAAWIVRNEMLAGNLTGPRPTSLLSLADILHDIIETVNHWVLPNFVAQRLPGWTFAFPAFVTLLFVWIARWSPQVIRTFWARNRVAIIFIVAYLAVLIGLSLAARFNRPGDRLLVPIYVPVVILAFSFLDCLIGLGQWPLRRVAGVMAVLSLAWLVYPAALVSEVVGDRMTGGRSLGVSSDEWQEGDVVTLLRKMTAAEIEQIHTNRPRFVFYFTGHHGKALYKEDGGEPQPEEFRAARKECPGKLVIWFFWNEPDRERFEQWKAALPLQPILETATGNICRVPGAAVPEVE